MGNARAAHTEVDVSPLWEQEQVAGLETGFEALRARFKDLDDRMTGAAQVATRLGDRLQVRRCCRTLPFCPARCDLQFPGRATPLQ